ncbi:MAG: hypothetical protein IPF41_11175 [Flavobacteriales bacterium]|nr:hypothetical protein [Flavobacteriales bacterium]
MNVPRALILLGGLTLTIACAAQADTLLLAADEHYVMGDPGEDPAPDLNAYERYNPVTAGDSVRQCNGFPCTGSVEDKYPDGRLKHKGYYDNGLLVLYRNYYPNGQLEREFKRTDDVRAVQRSWHANGQPRNEIRYAEGQVVLYKDHYINGALRYTEERQRNGGCYTRMELFDAEGRPISTLLLADKAKGLIDISEYHPGGALKCKGRARCDKHSLETTRIGTWTYFDPAGVTVRQEDYIDGKVHAVR